MTYASCRLSELGFGERQEPLGVHLPQVIDRGLEHGSVVPRPQVRQVKLGEAGLEGPCRSRAWKSMDRRSLSRS